MNKITCMAPVLLLAILLAFPVGHAFANASMAEENELDIRENIAKQFKDLFMQKKFDELNKVSERYRTAEERTPSGLWKLTIFYMEGIKLLREGSDDEKQRADLFAIAKEWIDKNPSPAAYIVEADLYSSSAWDIRGSSYASFVSKEKWAGFYTYLHKAHQILEESKAISSVDPEWYGDMIALSRDEQWQATDTEALYAEAITRFPYYYQIYFDILGSLLPKWRGSYKLIEEFATSAVEHTKEKEGNSMYARIYWNVAQNGYAFGNTLLNWNQMKDGIKDVLARYPDQWNINNFAYFSCITRDKDETKSLMLGITTPIPKAWNNNMALYNQCRDGQ